MAYPPDLLHGALHSAVTWTPFYYIIGFPALILLGRIPVAAAMEELARGGVVFALSVAVCAVLWRRGLGKFEAVGI